MSEASLTAFGAEALKPVRHPVAPPRQPAVDHKQQAVGELERFAQDIENMICAKLNAIEFTDTKGRKRLPLLDREDLAKKSRSQPRAIARHFSCYILRHHPFAAPGVSSPKLGARYCRDHTTILSGLKRASSLIASRHKTALQIQIGLDALADKYGCFNLFVREGSKPPPIREPNKPPPPRANATADTSQHKLDAYFEKRDRKIFALNKSGVCPDLISERFGINRKHVRSIISTQRRKSLQEAFGAGS